MIQAGMLSGREVCSRPASLPPVPRPAPPLTQAGQVTTPRLEVRVALSHSLLTTHPIPRQAYPIVKAENPGQWPYLSHRVVRQAVSRWPNLGTSVHCSITAVRGSKFRQRVTHARCCPVLSLLDQCCKLPPWCKAAVGFRSGASLRS